MKIARRKADNIVDFIFSDAAVLILTDNRLSEVGGLSMPGVKAITHEIIRAPEPPVFVPGAMTYSDGWGYFNTAAVAAKLLPVKTAGIVAEFNGAVAAMKAGYSDDEVKSWDKQEAEAEAVLADPLTVTPLLSARVARRGDTVAALAATVAANAAMFTSAYGDALGLLHSRQVVLAAIDLTAVDAIDQINAV